MPTPPASPAFHVKPGRCCHCGDHKLFGGDSDTSKYRRVRFRLAGGVVTTMAFCPDCVTHVADHLDDLKAQLLDGWWHGLHGRVYRQIPETGAWTLRQVAAPMPAAALEREWAKYEALVTAFAVDHDYGVKTYAEVDEAEGVLA